MLIVEEWIESSQEERQKHLRLDENCLERGGDSYQHRGILAQYLDTDIPKKRTINLCHACNNGACSNPRHLYWGTSSENAHDAIECGARPSQKGKPGHSLSEETRKRISDALRGRPSNNPTGITGPKRKGYNRKSSYKQKWITNGISNTRIRFDDVIPIGWRYGRIVYSRVAVPASTPGL